MDADPGLTAVQIGGLAAERLLKTIGEFPPFAVGITAAGEAKTYEITADGPTAAHFAEQVLRPARADARSAVIVASALVGLVGLDHLQLDARAICVQVEARGRPPKVVLRGYRKGAKGGYRFYTINAPEPPPFDRVFVNESGAA